MEQCKCSAGERSQQSCTGHEEPEHTPSHYQEWGQTTHVQILHECQGKQRLDLDSMTMLYAMRLS